MVERGSDHHFSSASMMDFAGDVEEGMSDFYCGHRPPVLCRGVEVTYDFLPQVVGYLVTCDHDVLYVEGLAG